MISAASPRARRRAAGRCPRSAVRHSVRHYSLDELAPLFQHAADFRYDAREYAADARLGEGGGACVRALAHRRACCVALVSSHPRNRGAHMAVSYLPEDRLRRGKVTC